MICPILPLGFTLSDCQKEECAWWDPENNQCGFGSLIICLRYIATFLADLRDKMPSEPVEHL